MTRLILGVTGSVAAIRTPALFAALVRGRPRGSRGGDAAVALLFRSRRARPAPTANRPRSRPTGRSFAIATNGPEPRYHRGDEVLHIEFRKWADLLIVAPLDANTLAKFALGLSDNFLSCIFRAWDFAKPVILAPAMNTLMWDSPVTLRHLRQLLEDRATGPVPAGWTLDDAPAIFARHAPRIILVPPQAKRLACGDVGVGAMAEVTEIAEVVRHWSNTEQPPNAGEGPQQRGLAGPSPAAGRAAAAVKSASGPLHWIAAVSWRTRVITPFAFR